MNFRRCPSGRRLLQAAWLQGLVCLVFVTSAAAQTVRPVVVEHKGKARSKFEVANDSVFPLNVVLEPKSFSVSEQGEVSFRPLDGSIHLKLSSMSFRLPPKQSYFVFYQATSDQLPAWFTIYCTFAGLPRQQGLNVQIDLPHTVYLLQKESLEKSHIQIPLAEYDEKAHRVRLEVENTGPCMGRAGSVKIRSGRENKTEAGFPLFPNSRRWLEIGWEAEEPPQTVLLRFPRFEIEQELIVRPK